MGKSFKISLKKQHYYQFSKLNISRMPCPIFKSKPILEIGKVTLSDEIIEKGIGWLEKIGLKCLLEIKF